MRFKTRASPSLFITGSLWPLVIQRLTSLLMASARISDVLHNHNIADEFEFLHVHCELPLHIARLLF